MLVNATSLLVGGTANDWQLTYLQSPAIPLDLNKNILGD